MHLSILTSLHPLIRDITTLALQDACHTLSVEVTTTSVHLSLTSPEGESEHNEIPLAHSCITCSMREGILPAIIELAELGCERLLLALPAAIDALSIVPALADIVDAETLPIDLSAVAHCVDINTACDDLLSHTLLRDKGLAVIDEDERCTGEVLMVSLGYADVLIALGEDPAGSDLVEHLRPSTPCASIASTRSRPTSSSTSNTTLRRQLGASTPSPPKPGEDPLTTVCGPLTFALSALSTLKGSPNGSRTQCRQ